MSRIKLGIAEDDAEFRGMLCEYLKEQADIEVSFIAKDGREAVEAVQNYQPEVLLLDMVMPRLDGLGVLEELSGLKLTAGPQTIVMSSLSHEGITRKAMGLGAAYYMAKPCSLRTLHQRIRQMAGREEEKRERRPVPAAMQNPYSHCRDLEREATLILCELGVPANMRGYQYLRDAILLSVEEPELLTAVTKELYPEVAKKNRTLAGRVEKNIRHAIETAWQRGRLETLDQMFGYTVRSDRGKPTNSEFIAIIADRLRLDSRAC